MAIFGEGKVKKSETRELCNEVDKIARKIDSITQNEIDNLLVRIDAELKSSGRELENSLRLLASIPGLADRLYKQIGTDAPQHIKAAIASIFDEIIAKADTVTSNIAEVQKNIKDVDKLTDEIDKKTDAIDALTDEIDELTDRYQK